MPSNVACLLHAVACFDRVTACSHREKKMHMLASLWNKIKMAVYNCQTSCDIG